MSHNAECIESVRRLLQQASRELSSVKPEAPQTSMAESLIGTIKANIDNPALSDSDFRQFVRNSLSSDSLKKG